MAADATTPFLWGSGGRRLTPEEILMERKASTALGSEAMSTAPVGHWSQGFNRVLQGLMAGYDGYSADQASKQNGLESSQVIAQAMSGMNGGAAPVAAPAVAPVASTTTPMDITPNGAAIRSGLIQRGLPEHVADGFLMNFKDESGLNPGLNEVAPIVPGSRGGFGLAQWTGPRRVGLEQYAAKLGKPVSDINTQLDYLSDELKGSEASAGNAILATKTPGEAAATIARSFLRPAPENLARRVAAYTGGAQVTPVSVASNDPAALPLNATETQGYVIPGQTAPVAAAPAAIQAPAINPAIAKALSNPYISDQARGIVKMLFQNQIEQQQKASDPLRQLQIKEAQSKLTPLSEPYRDSDGNLVQKDPTGKVTMLAPSRTQFSDIGVDSTTGNPVKGFVSPDSNKVIPYKMPGAENPAPSTLPPAPPGVDLKLWREGQSKSVLANTLPGSFDDTSKLRNEFTGLPAYKNMAQAAPVYQSMRDAAGRNTKAADLNIVYGLGKIMDPGSVVREGEIAMANNAQGWQEKLNGIIGQINSEGGLTPAGRERLMAEAHSRISAYKQQYDLDAGRYKGITERNRINKDDVIPDFGTFEPWTAPNNGEPIVIDGYKIKAR